MYLRICRISAFPCLPRTHLFIILLDNGNADDYSKFKAYFQDAASEGLLRLHSFSH